MAFTLSVSQNNPGLVNDHRETRQGTIAGKVAMGYIVLSMANRNSKRRAKAELKARRQSGQKLVNPESKRAGGRRGMGVRGRRSASMAA